MLGEYKQIYVGNSNDNLIRNNGSSGGVVTQLLVNAYRKKDIETALIVRMNADKPYKPELCLADNEDEIIKYSGSKYCYIHFRDYYDILLNTKKKIGLVATPCHVNSVRGLQKYGNFDHVKLIIGLFCGYNMTISGTKYLIKKSRMKLKDIQTIDYRGGDYPGGFRIKSGYNIKQYPKHYYDFLNLMFVPNHCWKCKLYTNELADISVGDAWGYQNKSLVIIRNSGFNRILHNIELFDIDREEVIKMHWFNLKHKKSKDTLYFKLIRLMLKYFGRIVPITILGSLAKIRRIIRNENFSQYEISKLEKIFGY